jgi:hypothetical protein
MGLFEMISAISKMAMTQMTAKTRMARNHRMLVLEKPWDLKEVAPWARRAAQNHAAAKTGVHRWFSTHAVWKRNRYEHISRSGISA